VVTDDLEPTELPPFDRRKHERRVPSFDVRSLVDTVRANHRLGHPLVTVETRRLINVLRELGYWPD
jgi:hypothetical protein